MSPLLLAAVALAGGAGAGTRFVLDGLLRAVLPGRVNCGTVLINLTGSLLLGLLTGMVLAGSASPVAKAVLGTGFLGGYTTFSTASLESVRLALGPAGSRPRSGTVAAAAVHAVGLLVGGVLLAGLGFVLGQGL